MEVSKLSPQELLFIKNALVRTIEAMKRAADKAPEGSNLRSAIKGDIAFVQGVYDKVTK